MLVVGRTILHKPILLARIIPFGNACTKITRAGKATKVMVEGKAIEAGQ